MQFAFGEYLDIYGFNSGYTRVRNEQRMKLHTFQNCKKKQHFFSKFDRLFILRRKGPRTLIYYGLKAY